MEVVFLISQWDFIFHDISDDEKLFGIIDEKSENWDGN